MTKEPHYPNPIINLEHAFIEIEGEEHKVLHLLKRLAEHEKHRAAQKARLTAMIEQKLPTNGHGEITASRLREVLEAIVAEL